MQINSAVEANNTVALQSIENTSSRSSRSIEGRADAGVEAGLASAINPNQALSSTEATRGSLAITGSVDMTSNAANESSFSNIPDALQGKYDKALDLAKLTSQAYGDSDNAIVDVGLDLFKGIDHIKSQDFTTNNYKELTQDFLGNDLKNGSTFDYPFGPDEGLDFTLFENTDTGDIVLSYRGSEPDSIQDWVNNAEQALLGKSEQYEAAIGLAREIQTQLDNYNAENGTNKQLTFTGHSLGGGLATAAALATGSEAIVFDAAGLNQTTIRDNGLDVNHADKILNINVQGDILSDHNGKMDNTTIFSDLIPGGTVQFGETVWLQGVGDDADFGGWLVPDWSPVEKLADSVLNHAWHVFTYQLENQNFVTRPTA